MAFMKHSIEFLTKAIYLYSYGPIIEGRSLMEYEYCRCESYFEDLRAAIPGG